MQYHPPGIAGRAAWLETRELLMTASLVARRPGAVVPRLQFPSVRTAAQTVLRLAASGGAIPAIVDDHDTLIWEYPGGDPAAEPARLALDQLRALAGETSDAADRGAGRFVQLEGSR